MSLSAVSFAFSAKEMQYALNIAELHSLRLWNCPQSLALLNSVVVTAQPLKLKSFELVIDAEWERDQGVEDNMNAIVSFLTALAGLEHLALLMANSFDWARLSRAISHHSRTLKRTVAHARLFFAYVKVVDNVVPWNDVMQGWYHDADLTFIGGCHDSYDMVCTSIYSLGGGPQLIQDSI